MDAIILEADAGAEGFTAIVTLVDSMSRYVKLIPVRTLQSVEFAQQLTAFMTTFGAPKEFFSDNHGQFTSAALQQVLKVFKTKLVHSNPGSSQENSQVERYNGLVREHLNKVKLMHSDRPWHLFLPFIERTLNSTVNSVTGFAPAAIIFGPGSSVLPYGSQASAETIAEWVDLISLYQDQATKISKHGMKQKQQAVQEANDKLRLKIFQPGALVWLQAESLPKKKLGIPRYNGPFTVLAQTDYTVTIVDMVTSGTPRNVHVSKLMDYVPSSDTSATTQVLQSKPDMFMVEAIVGHSFASSSRSKRPDGVHNMTVEVKWSGYEETSTEILKKNPSLLKTAALKTYFQATPALVPLIAELPLTVL
jgi:hypothetical protein